MEKQNRPRDACGECGGDLPAPAATGRPATYCGPVCRRAAEYGIRRAQILLTRAERAEQDARCKAATEDNWRAKDFEAKEKFWAAEVDRLRGVMRGVLAGVEDTEEDGPGTTPPRP